MIDATTVRQVSDVCTAFLTEHASADWGAPIPGMTMTVADAVAHAAGCCFWYAVDLAAGGDDFDHIDIDVASSAEPPAIVASLATGAQIAATVIETSPPGRTGFHPWGVPDASGFAGMACDEMLIHTDDAARGLGVEFSPPTELAEATLRRLFPEVVDIADPWQQLRWANGRIPWGDQPQRADWQWFCSPLSEWTG